MSLMEETKVRRLVNVLRVALIVMIWASGLFLGVNASQAGENVATQDPCGLLTAAEVEAVLGEPLSGPPFRANNGVPRADGASCRYETSAYRAIDLGVEWSDGGRKFGLINMASGIVDNGGLKGVVTLSNGTTLRGEWDEARDFLCCEFDALRGEQLVDVNVGSSRASIEQAASLANLAVKRLDQPLAFDDTPGLAAALERYKNRPATRPGCDLLTRAEAETIVGAPLNADPQGDDSSCQYAWSPAGADYTEQLTLSITWRGGLAEMRQAQFAIGQAMSFMSDQGLPTDNQTQQTVDKLFDEQAESLIGVMAVRKDVLLSIETSFTNNELASALIAGAAKKL